MSQSFLIVVFFPPENCMLRLFNLFTANKQNVELYFLQVIDAEENKEKFIELEQISIETSLISVVRLSI